MRPRNSLRLIVATLVCLLGLSGPSWSISRYSETLIAKKAGSTNAVVLAGGSVYVYTPGGTATGAETSGTTITMYAGECANFSATDTVEVGSTGSIATVASTAACAGSDQIEVNTSLSWVAGDRILNTTTEATIYADQGGSTAITQPATADSSGRVTFFVDTTTTSEFDLVASASGGLRLVDYAVVLIGVGSSAGGWTDGGTTVYPTTSTDSVAIGLSTADGKLHTLGEDDQAAAVADPVYTKTVEGDTYNQIFGWYFATDSSYYGYDDTGDVVISMMGDGGTGYHWYGDVENMSANNGVLRARPFQVGVAAMDIEGMTGQTANLLNVRLSTGALKFSIDKDGDLAAAGLTSTSTAFTATEPANFQDTMDVDGTLNVDGASTLVGDVTASAGLSVAEDLSLKAVKVTSTPYTAGTEFLIVVDTTTVGSNVVLNLPECASNDGRIYAIKNYVDGYDIIITAYAGEAVDNASTFSIQDNATVVRGSAIIQCLASEARWFVLSYTDFNDYP
jgi:hypothetical protein